MTKTPTARGLIFAALMVIAAGSGSSLYALGAKETPQMTVDTSSPWYLSPTGTSPSAKHTASVTVSVTMSMKSKVGYIPEYSLTVDNPDGTAVRAIVQKTKPDLGFFARLFSSRKQFTLTRTVSWDGKNNSGNVVADGTYPANLTIVAQDGTTQSTHIGDFVVDTQPPTASVSVPTGTEFNPAGTGARSKLQINQTNGSVEHLWIGTVADSAGTAVRTFKWRNIAPPDFTWDGTDDSGKLVPDGTYSYTLSSTDLAGNQSRIAPVSNIIVNTEKTPISIGLSNPYFSPNGDGVKDTTLIELSTSAHQTPVSWNIAVRDRSGKAVRSFTGEGAFPSTITFDGKNAAGALLPNGSYAVDFDAAFPNGNQAQATATVVVNVAPPRVALSLSNPAFSPNGDGIKDTTTADLSVTSPVAGEPVDSWSLQLKNQSGVAVRTLSQSGEPPAQIIFDGKNGSGQTLPDGSYTADFTATLADGTAGSADAPLVIDTKPPKVDLSVSSPIFMPNGTGADNTETISYTSNKPVTWTGELTNSKGQSLLTATTPENITKVTLDKSNPDVARAPAGLYTLALHFEDAAGNTYTPNPLEISLLTHSITASIAVAAAGFSPKAPAGSNTLTAAVVTNTPSGVARYDVDVLDANGRVAAHFATQGALKPTFTWTGTTGVGSSSYPADGTYTLRLTINYENGLKKRAASNPFLLDMTPPEIVLSGKPSPFVVSASGTSMTGSVNAVLQVADSGRTVRTWTAQLVSPSGASVKSVSGSGAVSQPIQWQGSLPLSPPAPTTVIVESYTAKITATDEYGNESTADIAVPVDIVGKVEGGKIHLLVPNLLFGPYKYALDSRSARQGQLNEQTLAVVARIMQRFPTYDLELDGYSMEIYPPSSPFYNEEENIIVPLSKNRADTALSALTKLGVPAARLAARYWGGMNTLVDPHNVNARWQNRRVEFILLPPGTQPSVEPAALTGRLAQAGGR